MKTYIIFNQNGEVSEKIYNCKYFTMSNFPEFKNCKTYNRYVILYNDNEDQKYNITCFKFTQDKYRGKIGLVKLGKNKEVADLKILDYYKHIMKKKINSNNLYYSSEEETYEYDFI